MSAPRLAWLLCALAGGLIVGACARERLDPAAERGRRVYLAQCTSCHSTDPASNGPLGPAVKGSSLELLEARLLRGAYPPGYTPKRPTAVMPPMPAVAPRLPDLAAYLR